MFIFGWIIPKSFPCHGTRKWTTALQGRTFLSSSDQRWVCTLLHITSEIFSFNRDIYVLTSLRVGVIASVWWGNAALPRAPTRSLTRRKVLRYLSFSIKAQELLPAPWKQCLSDIILHFLVASWGPLFHDDVVRRISSRNIAIEKQNLLIEASWHGFLPICDWHWTRTGSQRTGAHEHLFAFTRIPPACFM